MQKWAYLLMMQNAKDDYWLYYPNGGKVQLRPSTLAETLHQIGDEGWEAVNMQTWMPYSTSIHKWPEESGMTALAYDRTVREFLFKRPIEE